MSLLKVFRVAERILFISKKEVEMFRPKVSVVLSLILIISICVLITAAGCGKSPSIDSLNPSSGAAGTTIEIRGSGFGDSHGDSLVKVGDHSASSVEWSDKLISIKIPADLAAGDYGVRVITENNESNEVKLTVTNGDKKPDADADKDTPAYAMTEYMKAQGIDTSGWNFSVVNQSKTDANWKIDSASKSGFDTLYFIMHHEGSKWVVKQESKDLYGMNVPGMPTDLMPQKPQTDSKEDVAKAAMKDKGIDTTGYSLALDKTSTQNPSVLRMKATKEGATTYYVILEAHGNSWDSIACDSFIDPTTARGKIPEDLYTDAL